MHIYNTRSDGVQREIKIIQTKVIMFHEAGKEKKKETKAACWRWTTCSLDGPADR